MARIRTIKPDFFASEQVASVPYEWRLLFVGLWTHADREGRLLDRPARLKATLFPYDDLDVNDGLESLYRVGLVTRYEVDGVKLIAIPTWLKHQQPHIKESRSVLPAPGDHEHGASMVLEPQLGKGTDPDQEGKGTVPDALRARFERFWSEYPRKTAKDAAWKEWLKRSPSDDLAQRMIEAVRQQRASAQWLKDGGQFIPHPRTWLHQGRWQDEPDTPIAKPQKPDWYGHFPHCRNEAACAQRFLSEERAKEKVSA